MEVEDLKKISGSLTALLSEKQKQEKVGSFQEYIPFSLKNKQTSNNKLGEWQSVVLQQLKKGKNRKKGVVPAGGFKAKMKDDLADYGEFDGGYAQDYEDFM